LILKKNILALNKKNCSFHVNTISRHASISFLKRDHHVIDVTKGKVVTDDTGHVVTLSQPTPLQRF